MFFLDFFFFLLSFFPSFSLSLSLNSENKTISNPKQHQHGHQGDFIVLGRTGSSAAASGWVIRVNKPTAPGFPCTYTPLISGIVPWAGTRGIFFPFSFFSPCPRCFRVFNDGKCSLSLRSLSFMKTRTKTHTKTFKKMASAPRPSPTCSTASATAPSSPSSSSRTAPPPSSRSWPSPASRDPGTSPLPPETSCTPSRVGARTPTRSTSTPTSTRRRCRRRSRRRAR